MLDCKAIVSAVFILCFSITGLSATEYNSEFEDYNTKPEVTLASRTESATANHAAVGNVYKMVTAARDATVAVTTESGFGTGFYITDKGIVVTNYHVIHGAKSVRIWAYGPDELNFYPGVIMGIDPVADLAIIQAIFPEHKKPVSFLTIENDLDKIKVMDDVWAIGHPNGLDWTITEGTVSHRERAGRITMYVKILQHSALIAEGSSGGPLINNDGKVVGVNTYVLGSQKQFAYATRGDEVYESILQMLSFGKVYRPAMASRIAPLNPFSRERLLEENPSAAVAETFGLVVMPGTEEDGNEYAFSQGLEEFDVIVAVNGLPVNNMDDLSNIIPEFRPDDIITLMVLRQGGFKNIKFKLSSFDFDYLDYYNKQQEKRQQSLPAPPEGPE